MKNILALTLFATGLLISTISSPAFAGQVEWERKRTDDIKEKIYQDGVMDRQRRDQKTQSPATGPGSSSSYDGSPSDVLVGLFLLFSPSVISSNGVVQYGVHSNVGVENMRFRAGMHFGGGGTSGNLGFTAGLGDKSARLKPFVGAGLGFKTFPVKKNFESSVASLYGTGGVDLKLSDNFSVTGAINIPMDSAYGTEYQVGISFFNF